MSHNAIRFKIPYSELAISKNKEKSYVLTSALSKKKNKAKNFSRTAKLYNKNNGNGSCNNNSPISRPKISMQVIQSSPAISGTTVEGTDDIQLQAVIPDSDENSNSEKEQGPSSDSDISQETLDIQTDRNEDDTSHCPICLHSIVNLSYLYPCYHCYCFSCIRQWLTVVVQCPLCKKSADFIIHDVDEAKGTFERLQLSQDSKSDKHYQPSSLSDQAWDSEDGAVSLSMSGLHQRRRVYTNNLHVMNFPAHLNGDRLIYKSDMDRLEHFVERELRVLMPDHYDELIKEYVMSLLLLPAEKGMLWSEVVKSLSPWLGEFSRKFLEEIWIFTASAMNLEMWDRTALYGQKETVI
ncbi:5337_t:CDS:1 [Paraglomus brasilianum]|uniref:5337_t:CDS:1 n=1 Tax=Paraglomus brasilianum TaxID=144538 RepID=A0A9N9CND8_9GLOM|nr:5337_t:CDS:1 [Paraglomus brasilianum]